MNFDEFKQVCRKSWEEEHNYLQIDGSKKKDQGKLCICKESKNKYIESNPETKAF